MHAQRTARGLYAGRCRTTDVFCFPPGQLQTHFLVAMAARGRTPVRKFGFGIGLSWTTASMTWSISLWGL
jgi:hypothetical protein